MIKLAIIISLSLVIADFFLGVWIAYLTKTPSYHKFYLGYQKAVLWVILMYLSATLESMSFIQDMSIVHSMSVYLFTHLLLAELVSVLRNTMSVSLLLGVHLPFLSKIIDKVERMV
jgi:phage-related holin